MPLRRLSAVPPALGGYTPVGARAQQVTLYLPGGRNADGSQQPSSPWAENVWGDMRALSGAEMPKAQQLAQQATHLLVIAYQLGISENMTIDFNGRIFQIHYIEDPDERQVSCESTVLRLARMRGRQANP